MSRFLLRVLALIYFALFVACVLMSAGFLDRIPLYDMYYQSFPDLAFVGPLILLLFAVLCWVMAGAPSSTGLEEGRDFIEIKEKFSRDDSLIDEPTWVMRGSLLEILVKAEAFDKNETIVSKKAIPLTLAEPLTLTEPLGSAAIDKTDETVSAVKTAEKMVEQGVVAIQAPQVDISVNIGVNVDKALPEAAETAWTTDLQTERKAISKNSKQDVIDKAPFKLKGLIKIIGRNTNVLINKKIAEPLYKVVAKGLTKVGMWIARTATAVTKDIPQKIIKLSNQLMSKMSQPFTRGVEPTTASGYLSWYSDEMNGILEKELPSGIPANNAGISADLSVQLEVIEKISNLDGTQNGERESSEITNTKIINTEIVDNEITSMQIVNTEITNKEIGVTERAIPEIVSPETETENEAKTLQVVPHISEAVSVPVKDEKKASTPIVAPMVSHNKTFPAKPLSQNKSTNKPSRSSKGSKKNSSKKKAANGKSLY